jgi:hypothetical protein
MELVLLFAFCFAFAFEFGFGICLVFLVHFLFTLGMTPFNSQG